MPGACLASTLVLGGTKSILSGLWLGLETLFRDDIVESWDGRMASHVHGAGKDGGARGLEAVDQGGAVAAVETDEAAGHDGAGEAEVVRHVDELDLEGGEVGEGVAA